MRLLTETAEDGVPDDVLLLNESIRKQYNRLGAAHRPLKFDRPMYLNESTGPGTQQFLRTATGPPLVDILEQNEMPEAAYPLERWMIQAHAYSEEQAAHVSMFGRLFSGEAQRVKAGVVHDAKRFSVVSTEKSRLVEFGVAVRLSVATSSVSGKFELTLPNLAADAQLNGIEARVGITVLGYSGPLGDILPAPRKLDVETCAEYLEAFRKIQSVIFGKDGWQYVIPTALAYDEADGST